MSLMKQIKALQTRWFQPDPDRREDFETIQERNLARMAGLVAVGLPIVLIWAGLQPQHCFRDSVSHFYFDPFFGGVVVGALIFIALFLIVYHPASRGERIASTIAGVGAAMVALVPTTGTGCEAFGDATDTTRTRLFADILVTGDTVAPIEISVTQGFTLLEQIKSFHVIGAAIMFLYLGLYCMFVLTRTVEERHLSNGKTRPSKARRNRFYVICGGIIIACAVALAFKQLLPDDNIFWNANNLTFWVEAIALWAFGAAWAAKGRLTPRSWQE